LVTQPFSHGVVNGADSVTDVVLKAMSRTPDPRLRELMESLVRHLHAFVRETKPTEEEFEIAVDFLVRLGQASGAQKNEVILLSDLLGVSTLVMLLNNARGLGETDSRSSARSGARARRSAIPAIPSRAAGKAASRS
jgi:catechol 1,2-dioxygenase